SLDELRQRIRDDLVAEEAHRFEHDVDEKAIDQLIARNEFDVPEDIVKKWAARMEKEVWSRRKV
ncbi:MAG: hypothetical protein ACMUHY_06920, partial [Thermoplasmatota archaeon]